MGCNALSSVYIDSVESWMNIDFNTISSNPLAYAKKLYINNKEITSLDIPETIVAIKKYTFYGWSSLTSVNIGNSVAVVNDSAFSGCSKLANVHYSGDSESWNKITISSGNESLTNAFRHYNSTGSKIVWTYADGVLNIGGSGEMDEYKGFLNSRPWLAYLKNIKYVVIEGGVTTIGSSAFEGMSALTEVTFKGSAPKFGENCFKGTAAVAKYTCDETWTSDVLQNYGGTIIWNATLLTPPMPSCLR